ncbi:hypothetical protein ABWI13_13175 [Streptomyces koyangensis]|uniref:hypothetical protein n=1 Tax=Streptomyces koyangensis TaxID=188770 RepID=UPI00337A53AE
MGGEVGHVCFAGDGDCGPEGFLGLSGEGGVRLVEGAERRAVGELGPEDEGGDAAEDGGAAGAAELVGGLLQRAGVARLLSRGTAHDHGGADGEGSRARPDEAEGGVHVAEAQVVALPTSTSGHTDSATPSNGRSTA